MKKFLSLLLGAVGIVALSACGSEELKPSGNEPGIPSEGKYEEFDFRGQGYLDKDYIALKHVLYDLAVGGSKQIEVETYPTQYAANSLNYHSTDDAIVSVDSNGKLTGLKKGVADVVVSAKDGSFSNKVRVVVSEKSNKAAVQSVLDSLNDTYNDPGYKSPRRVLRYEYSIESYACEGVMDHATESYEAMGYDADEGYFFVEGPSLYYKTQNGTPQLADGKWIMYPINQGVMTRLIHITPTAKNYFDINTANYSSYEAIIKDIMNFFFVSGEKIVNDLLADFDGKEDLNDFAGYSSTTLHSVDDNSIYLEYTEQNTNQVVDYSDEINHFDIPADTVYSYDYKQCLLNNGSRTKGVDIAMTMYYKLNDGKNWTRTFNRSQLFEGDFERVKISNPKDNGYKAVDSIYDL